MKTLKNLSKDELIKDNYKLQDLVKCQQKELKKLAVLAHQAREEVKGAKVLMSAIVQQQGGKIVVTDTELVEHVFDLRIETNYLSCNHIITSNAKRVSKPDDPKLLDSKSVH